MRQLHPQVHHSVSLCDALDRVLHTGVVALGEITISVADIDLLYLGLQLVITSIEKGRAPHDLAGSDAPGPSRVVRGGPCAELPQSSSLGSVTETVSSAPAQGRVTAPAAAPDTACQKREAQTLMSSGQNPNKNGLGQLVLTLVRLLHELLKRQAIRRMEAGSLSVAEMENLGVTLMRQAREIERLAEDLGLELGDLNLDLGPLGKLL